MAKPSKPLAGLALVASGVGVAALVSQGLDEVVNELWCFQIALLLEILLISIVVVCLLTCDESERCRYRCITILIVGQILIMVFLILCLMRAGGVF